MKHKTVLRFFTIADYEEEEIWLRRQQQEGWKLVEVQAPCFYTFAECEPEDVIYRLDYKNSRQTGEYLQMLKDFGWEYGGECLGWLYFRKAAALVDAREDGELFTDQESKLEMIETIVKTRLMPLVVIFFCCLLPNLIRAIDGYFSPVWNIIFGSIFACLFVVYVFLIVYCSIKLRKIRNRERDRSC